MIRGLPRTPAFSPALVKLRIASVDEPTIQIMAQYNPKELGISKTNNWTDNKSVTNKPDANGRTDNSPQDDVTFTGSTPRTISIELLFDGYEKNMSVSLQVKVLEKLAAIRKPDAGPTEEPLKRPHHCMITWGASGLGMGPFLCVIKQLDVKYSAWDTTGMPLRATCTVSVMEVIKLKK